MPGVAPTRPGIISLISTTRTSLTYEITPVYGEDTGGTDTLPITVSYEVWISPTGKDDYELINSPSSAGQYEVSSLIPGKLYYLKYRV